MEKYLQEELTKRYKAAADSFIDKIKGDPNVVAAILGGSLSYDQVWEKSDIDMTLIVRDQSLKNDSFSLIEDDITINVSITTRSGFKRFLESQRGGSMFHSFLMKGKIIYTNDDSLYEYFEDMRTIGSDDIAQTMFYAAGELCYYCDKTLKWLTVKKDLLYAQYYLLKAAEVIARMEVCHNGEIPTREAIRRARQLNPVQMSAYYDRAMSHHYDTSEIEVALRGMEQYLERHLETISKPVVDYMADGEMKTITMIAKFFHTESHFIAEILDFLAERGILLKLSQTIRITPKSKLAVEEITYQYIKN